MILYHGTNIDFKDIDFDKCVPFKDFGKGFYLTDIQEQAEALAKKKSRLFGGSPIVQEYVFISEDAEKAGLKMLRFETPSKEWAEFIFNNRNRNSDFHHDYDIIYGPIANDGVAYLLGRYEEGSIDLDELAKELEFRDLNNQYYFGTQKAIELLKRL